MAAKYDFVSEPHADYICPVTLGVMLDPHQTECCGNHLASSVVEKLSLMNKPCPLCNAPNPSNCSAQELRKFKTNRDGYIQRKILELSVYCSYRKSGCKWVGSLREVQRHTSSCDQRPWECQHCYVKSTYKVIATEHAQKCLKRPMQCSCNTGPIPFCEYDDHVAVCPAQVVQCDFEDVGCYSTFFRSDTSQHMREYISYHQLLVAKANFKLTKEISVKLYSTSENKIKDLQQELKEKDIKIKKLQEAVDQENQPKSGYNRQESAMDREGLVRRLQEQLQEREEAEETARRLQGRHNSLSFGEVIVTPLQGIIDGLKSKSTLGKKDISEISSKLEEVIEKVTEARSVGDEDFVSVSPDLFGIGVEGLTSFFGATLVRTIVQGLKRAWGVTVGGDKLFVVDNCGKFGLHIVDIHETVSSVESMIPSASFSDAIISPGKCWYPRGVALDKDMNILMVDSGSHRILKLSPEGEQMFSAGTESLAGKNSTEFNRPIGVGVNPNGRIFVCDTLNNRLQIFDSNLGFLEEFGEQGNGPKKFLYPWDVAFDKKGNIYVADCGNRCIKVFTPNLVPLKEIGKGEEKYKKGDLRAPTSLCLDANDYLYVTDKGLKKVLVYNSLGKFKCSFGKFIEPYGIAVDKDGCVYVSDNGGGYISVLGTGRVQVFA